MANNSPLQFSKMYFISNTYIILQRYYYPHVTGEKFEAQEGSGQLEVSHTSLACSLLHSSCWEVGPLGGGASE